jgi:hypothetical protein
MENRINQFCFQTYGRTDIKFGIVTDQWLDKHGWGIVKVEWQTGNITEERIVNVNFDIDLCTDWKQWAAELLQTRWRR